MRFLLCVLFATPCFGEDGPKPPTDAEIREAKVYEMLAEIASRRDDLLRKFAVVMHGEIAGMGSEQGPHRFPRINARVVDRSRSFDMSAGYMVHRNSRPHFEDGHVTIRVGTTHKAIENNPLVSPALVKPSGTKLSVWQKKYVVSGGADPYDDYLAGANSIWYPNQGSIEKLILAKYELVKTERGLNQTLVSHWAHHPHKLIDWRITITFDPAYEMMPTRVQIENKAIKNDYQETRITWRKHKKTLLPFRIEVANGDLTRPNRSSECTFRCYWLVGDEVPNAIFDSENQLGALLDHFEIARTRRINGKVVPLQHEYPKDLFEKPASEHRSSVVLPSHSES